MINLPSAQMVDTAVGIGNCSGVDGIDKFAKFDLTARAGRHVKAPLIAECPANFECKLFDDSQIDQYGLFIWEVVQAHVAPNHQHVKTLHYLGEGEFSVSGNHISKRSKFKSQNL